MHHRFLTPAAVALLAIIPAHAAAKPTRKFAPHRGGKVRLAWPHKHGRGHAPPKGDLRWLARQVGHKAVKRARAAATTSTTTGTSAVQFSDTSLSQPLALVRSYAIPSTDPSAERLTNLSWTYDSAVTAMAFMEWGLKTQAEQLLDQLASLQRTDGSIDFAFNTATGDSMPLFRTGTVAAVGLAAVMYRMEYASKKYDAVITRAAQWLLTRRVNPVAGTSSVLLTGGPDVTWRSTQHNLLALAFFRHLAWAESGHAASRGLDPLTTTAADALAASCTTAADQIDTALSSYLLVKPTSTTAYFKEGLDDDVRPLDAQALGILWLLSDNRKTDATYANSYLQANFKVDNRTIAKSDQPATYNSSYTATGPFSGYKPYANTGTPDVLWREGTSMVRYAMAELGVDTTSLDTSMSKWDLVTGLSGPLQSDRTVTGSDLNEYHVWPSASAAAWKLAIFSSLPDLFRTK